jgi:hypothetical protein
MNLNQIVQQLYNNSDPWITYTQRIYLLNPFLDSAYNNHILYEKEYIQLTIPYQINVIYNLRASFQTDIFVVKKSTISSVKDNFLFNERDQPIVLRFQYPTDLDHTIEFSAVVFKNNVRSQLSKL